MRTDMRLSPAMSVVRSDGAFFEDAMDGALPLADNPAAFLGQTFADPPRPASEDLRIDEAVEITSLAKVPAPKILKKTSQRRRPQPKAKDAAADDAALKNEDANTPAPQTDKRKRARKPPKKSTPASQATEDAEAEADPSEQGVNNNNQDSSSAPGSQRSHILERNRIAATKCRIRKRSEASTLASCEQEMEDQNRQLSACFDALRQELLVLKTQLLQHADCDCVLIQRYIANEAQKSVDRMVGAGSGSGPEPRSAATPDVRASSGGSTAVDSPYMHSPMTSVPVEGAPIPWSKTYGQGNSGVVQTQMIEGFQPTPPGMTQYNMMSTHSSMNGYAPRPAMGMTVAQSPLQAAPSDLNYVQGSHQQGWSPGWQME